MAKGILSPFFPATQRDVSRLRQSATDAVNDFSSGAINHANKVGSQLSDLADHLQDEGRGHLDRATTQLLKVARTGRDFAAENPLPCLGVAVVVGILIGLSFRRQRQAR